MAKIEAHSELKALLDQWPETRFLELLVTDMNGIFHGKRAALQEFPKIFKNGVNYCAATIILDSQGATYDNIPYGTTDGDPDVRARVVPGTLAPVPWAAAPTAQALVELSEFDGTPFFLDPRHVLDNALRPLRDLGLRPVMATELEFYLVEHDGTTFHPRMPRIPGSELPQPGRHYAVMDDLVEIDGFLSDLDRHCRSQSIPAGAALSEFAPGQFEVNLDHVEDPMRACEHAVLLKRAIKATARQHGMAATFMAKPFAGIPGSGLHIHVSLLDRHGENVFAGESRDGPFSDTLRHAIGGLARLMPESMTVFAPNANSYRRFVPGAFVPATPNWGYNHRGVALRVPLSTPVNCRVEHRVSGADANPYLVTAAVMAGIHYGITERCEPGVMIQPGEQIERKITLPLRWPLSLAAFDAAKVLPGYFGEDFCRVYGTCRHEESDRFQTEVSNRDYEWYLRAV